MRVAELIRELMKYPNDMRVMVSGYESGLKSKFTVQQKKVVATGYDTAGPEYMLGDFEEVSFYDDETDGFDAICIER